MKNKFPYKMIDLSHSLENKMPTWDGNCGFMQSISVDYSDCDQATKFRVMSLAMHAGIGTHMDSPAHCIAGGKTIGELDVNDLVMPCVVIDVAHKAHQNYSVSMQDVEEFEQTYGTIAENSCVMIRTGWSNFWSDANQYRNNLVFPNVSVEAAKLLLARKISALGIDTLSPDLPIDDFPVHQALLGQGKIIVENVAGLEKMPPVGGFVMALPLKIVAGTESPLRLVGLVLR